MAHSKWKVTSSTLNKFILNLLYDRYHLNNSLNGINSKNVKKYYSKMYNNIVIINFQDIFFLKYSNLRGVKSFWKYRSKVEVFSLSEFFSYQLFFGGDKKLDF